jgi:hypothetical protein
MAKLYVRIMLTFCVLVIAIPLIIFAFIKFNLHTLETKTIQYLLEDKAFNKANIMSIKSTFGKAPLFSVNVVFKDEPEVVYYYKLGEDRSIFQYSHTSINNVQHYTYKHIEQR